MTAPLFESLMYTITTSTSQECSDSHEQHYCSLDSSYDATDKVYKFQEGVSDLVKLSLSGSFASEGGVSSKSRFKIHDFTDEFKFKLYGRLNPELKNEDLPESCKETLLEALKD